MVTLSSCLIWQIIRFILQPNEYGCVYAWTTMGMWARDRHTESADFDKKIIFSDEAHFDLGGYVSKRNCRICGTENPHACIEKPTRPKRVTVRWGFWSRGIIGPFFFENEQAEAVIVNCDRCWMNFCSQELKRRILATFGFNRMALRATQPQLQLMFRTLFLKMNHIFNEAGA